jgi:hypothetical protein
MFPYTEGYFYSDLENWNKRILRRDQFAALCYMFGVLPDYDISQSLDEQISYVHQNKTRTPANIVEIGAGRGELSCTLSKMGVSVTPIDVASNIQNWFNRTGEHFFGNDFIVPKVIETHIQAVAIDFRKFDTIIMVESLEHIVEEEFQSTWHSICSDFKGLFCVTNLLCMHPIPIGNWGPDAEKQHCRIIDDELYDNMSKQAKQVVYRNNSHLVLEF